MNSPLAHYEDSAHHFWALQRGSPARLAHYEDSAHHFWALQRGSPARLSRSGVGVAILLAGTPLRSTPRTVHYLETEWKQLIKKLVRPQEIPASVASGAR
jgi:hypothetical protein